MLYSFEYHHCPYSVSAAVYHHTHLNLYLEALFKPEVCNIPITSPVQSQMKPVQFLMSSAFLIHVHAVLAINLSL
jgi:hypothetical protein